MALPSSAAWALACDVVHANIEIVRTTRVPAVWAWLITVVILLLVHPAQPVVAAPVSVVLRRFPAESEPTLKYAMVDSTR